MIDNDVHVCPPFEFPLPIGNGGERCNNEEWPANSVLADGVDKGQRLNCLAQTHLVGENAVVPIVPREEQPIESFELIGPQVVSTLVDWRLVQFLPGRGSRFLSGLKLEFEHKQLNLPKKKKKKDQ